MWRGEAQGDVERRMIPAFSMAENSALAAASLAGSKRRALANTGGPGLVMMWWRTLCRGGAAEKPSVDRTSGKSDRRLEIHLGEESKEARRVEEGVGEASSTQGEADELLKTFWLTRSTTRRW